MSQKMNHFVCYAWLALALLAMLGVCKASPMHGVTLLGQLGYAVTAALLLVALSFPSLLAAREIDHLA